MKITPSNMTWLNLPNMPRTVKSLFVGYLLVAGLGLCMAGMQILLTHGMADGKFGLSVDDVVYSYYGDRTSSKIEGKLNGSMQLMAPPEVRMDIIKWVRNGAPEAEWEPHFKQVFANYCVACHSIVPGIPDYRSYAGVQSVSKLDTGKTVQNLTRISHIHLFGISFIFFIMGFIFSFAVGVPRWLKMKVILFPFGFIILDILSWWLTKLNPGFAWLIIIGGIGWGLSALFMWCVSMYQMLIMSRTDKVYGNAWEADI